ncbi:MAG: ethanolamine ammonia-lyase light chain EutC, partial [Spirochaetia bacterium]|nr:ethanolamine ammonia-lyase light chain EutC [Spirochaetia bacterium]
MDRDELVALITKEVIEQLKAAGWKAPDKPVPPPFAPQEKPEKKELPPDFDIASDAVKKIPLLENPIDPVELSHMKKRTTARIGVGKCGARLNTQTMLTLRADHAKARDAVMKDVDENLIKSMNLFSVKTQCDTKDIFITRPDLGRKLSEEGVATLKEKC